jgi:O-antigen/teichoic acid export membrane protein
MHSPQPARQLAALLLMAGRVVGAVFAVVTAGVLTRCWSEQDYGEYRQVWLGFQTLSPFVTLGIPAGLTFFLPQIDPSRQKAAVAQAGVLLGVAGGLISVVNIGWSSLAAGQTARGTVSPALAFGFYPVFAMPLLVAETWLLAIQRSRTAALLIIQTAVLQSAAAILPALTGAGVVAVMGWLSLATFFRFLIALRIYRAEYSGIAATWDPGFPRRLLSYAVPLGLAGVIGNINLLLDKLLIAYRHDPAEFAIYSNGATELPVIGIVSSSIAAVLAPEFVRLFQAARLSELLALWRSSICTTATIIFPLTAAMLLFAPDAVTLLYSEKYLASVPIFRIYLLVLPLRITVHGSLLVAAGHSRPVFLSSVIGLIVASALLGILAPLFGMPGAAAAMVLSVYAVAGMLIFCTAHVVGVTWIELLPWRELVVTLLASAAGAASAAVVTQQLDRGCVRLFLGIGVVCSTCVVITLASRCSDMSLTRR